MTNAVKISSLEIVADAQARLRVELRLPWPADVAQAVARLCVDGSSSSPLPAMVALLGGASSGKSTIFDNLLGGRLASRITARGHATLGPILAVHEMRHDALKELLTSNRFLSGYQPRWIELDDNVTGCTSEVAIVRHTVDALRDVFLFDLPDFTSGAAADEGDVALSLLPWFDRIILVLDHERWFDRQSTSTLRERSVRFGFGRWVMFNQTQDAELSDDQRRALTDQADALGTSGLSFLEYRRGRGLCRFPPDTFKEMLTFVAAKPPARRLVLCGFVANAAGALLDQNEERAVRLKELRRAMDSLYEQTIPDQRACMMALMTPDERRQTEWLARVFRINETRHWLSGQTRRLAGVLRQVPVLGTLMTPGARPRKPQLSDTVDRAALGRAFALRVAERHQHEMSRLTRNSRFWDEVRRWTGTECPATNVDASVDLNTWLGDDIAKLNAAIQSWNDRVEKECEGVAPQLQGAVGAGTLALAIVLVAVPGPVTALTAIAAKGAIAAGLTHILAATGVGALAGKPAMRLASVVQERLIGSAEYLAVKRAIGGFRSRLQLMCARMNDEALAQASAMVLPKDDRLFEALEELRDASEECA